MKIVTINTQENESKRLEHVLVQKWGVVLEKTSSEELDSFIQII